MAFRVTHRGSFNAVVGREFPPAVRLAFQLGANNRVGDAFDSLLIDPRVAGFRLVVPPHGRRSGVA